ncbi:hypothetical protein F5888DRAFT_1735417 [Russula emetica]|nr:hypothetical protein F5888DRAFT_1735417 [Russula emetica]
MVRVHLVFVAPFVLLQRISSLPFNCLNDRSRALHAHHNTIRPFEIEVPKRPRVSVPKEKSFFSREVLPERSHGKTRPRQTEVFLFG